MTNKKRELAEDAIAPTLYLLKKADVPRSLIADVLFKYLKSFVVPDDDAPEGSETIWYAQLKRFRDELQDRIDIIEETVDKPHG